MAPTVDGRWLSLGRACDILGVNETTLRHWADAGRIRAFRTPGGHRRFSRDDLNGLIQVAAAKPNGPLADGPVAHTALERMRRQIGRQKRRNDPWQQFFDDEGRARMRVLGRRLVSLATEYVGRRRRRVELQEEARDLGNDYGRELASRNIGLDDAISAFIFFRHFLHATVGHHGTNAEHALGIRSILDLEDLVLLGMATVCENGLAGQPATLTSHGMG